MATSIHLKTQQEISCSDSSNAIRATTLTRKICTSTDSVEPCTSMLHKELCTSFKESSSSVDTQNKPIPLARRLMQEKYATYSLENQASTSKHHTITNLSRSLENMNNRDQLQCQTVACSDPNISADALSLVHKIPTLQSPLTTSAAMTEPLHYDYVTTNQRPFEDIYDYIGALASPEYYITPRG